jgi:hypothetical protein
MQNMSGRGRYTPGLAAVYNIKSFSLTPVGAIQVGQAGGGGGGGGGSGGRRGCARCAHARGAASPAAVPTPPGRIRLPTCLYCPPLSPQECYIPMDVDGCFGSSNALDEQLIYWWVGPLEPLQRRPGLASRGARDAPRFCHCTRQQAQATASPPLLPPPPKKTPRNRPRSPYTFKDSLKNPWLRRVVMFHDIGLDRLVNTFRNPVAVTRPVTYASCRGTRHVGGCGGGGTRRTGGAGRAGLWGKQGMHGTAPRAFCRLRCAMLTWTARDPAPHTPQILDLDHVTASVVVGTMGVLTFDGIIIQVGLGWGRVGWGGVGWGGVGWGGVGWGGVGWGGVGWGGVGWGGWVGR